VLLRAFLTLGGGEVDGWKDRREGNHGMAVFVCSEYVFQSQSFLNMLIFPSISASKRQKLATIVTIRFHYMMSEYCMMISYSYPRIWIGKCEGVKA
jgi:hypothetical protein